MDVPIPKKTYFRIGEVSKILSVDPYVVRYWESEFKSVKPIRTKSDQRLYRRKDVEELLTIKKLLYSDKYTISGAKRQLSKIRGDVIGDDQDRDRGLLLEIKKGLREIRDIVS
ncbi:MAG: MerR family transcriptional regulator [Deltaproteobacteria bacterium]|nr:MerR family transcriptional regulator [Deltaproteobacteria bacterium]